MLAEDNIVRVAGKQKGAYINAVLTKLERYDEVCLTAFGNKLNRAYEIAEFVTKLKKGVKLVSIEQIEQEDRHGKRHFGIRVTLRKVKKK